MTTPAPPRLVASEVRREAATETTAASEAAVGMQAFAHRLLSEHPELFVGPNAVLSSSSIGTAFAMLRLGAEGETVTQIDAVLGFPAIGLGPAYNFLTGQWSTTGDDGPELAIANSLFVRDGFGLDPDFLDALARDFGAGVRTVDFTSDEAVRVINAWVRRVRRVGFAVSVAQSRPETVPGLANAVCPRAGRGIESAASSTYEGEFRRETRAPVRAPLRRPTRDADYVPRPDWPAVRLP